jgi:DNA modification methylase
MAQGRGVGKNHRVDNRPNWYTNERPPGIAGHDEFGGASRFFYTAKPGAGEKNHGCDDLPEGQSVGGGGTKVKAYGASKPKQENFHPTVKSIKLMRYLIRLITPPTGKVLDPFMGSGSTGVAAIRGGFGFVGIEMSKDFYKVAEKRIEKMVPSFKKTPQRKVKFNDLSKKFKSFMENRV